MCVDTKKMGGSAEIIFSFPTLHIHLLYIQVMDLVLNDERPYVGYNTMASEYIDISYNIE